MGRLEFGALLPLHRTTVVPFCPFRGRTPGGGINNRKPPSLVVSMRINAGDCIVFAVANKLVEPPGSQTSEKFRCSPSHLGSAYNECVNPKQRSLGSLFQCDRSFGRESGGSGLRQVSNQLRRIAALNHISTRDHDRVVKLTDECTSYRPWCALPVSRIGMTSCSPWWNESSSISSELSSHPDLLKKLACAILNSLRFILTNTTFSMRAQTIFGRRSGHAVTRLSGIRHLWWR